MSNCDRTGRACGAENMSCDAPECTHGARPLPPPRTTTTPASPDGDAVRELERRVQNEFGTGDGVLFNGLQYVPMKHFRDAITLASRLQAELAGGRADAERYAWLRPRLLALDSVYGERRDNVLVFLWPESARVSMNLDQSIDAAISGAAKDDKT